MTVIQVVEKKTILSKSNLPVSDYSVNPYVGCTHGCQYCYASFMKRFTGHREEWGEFLDVKQWLPLRSPEQYRDKALFIGSVTDPYNPQEAQYQRTRALLQELQGSGAKITIQTKSDLVLRDMDLIQTFPDARVGFSINTLDEQFKNDMDKAVSIERRLSAMKQLYDAGIRTTCFISPIFPEITDVPAIIERVKMQCQLIWLENLNLRGNYKPVILNYIQTKYPHLMPLYQQIYLQGDNSYWQQLDQQLQQFAQYIGLDYVVNDDSMQRSFNAPPVMVNFFYHEKIKKSAQKASEEFEVNLRLF